MTEHNYNRYTSISHAYHSTARFYTFQITRRLLIPRAQYSSLPIVPSVADRTEVVAVAMFRSSERVGGGCQRQFHPRHWPLPNFIYPNFFTSITHLTPNCNLNFTTNLSLIMSLIKFQSMSKITIFFLSIGQWILFADDPRNIQI